MALFVVVKAEFFSCYGDTQSVRVEISMGGPESFTPMQRSREPIFETKTGTRVRFHGAGQEKVFGVHYF
ncbi:MAG TPA: hypothetical protein VJB59_07460, partial [Bdellovibrionota bacterium]|nr:hypothetical protein [Bdellovibrionota bacterium]